MSPSSNRAFDQLRAVKIERGIPSAAQGSVLISAGQTVVLCTASISTDAPGWMTNQQPPRGWVTAEYQMLPGSTSPRKKRGPDGRGTEIQRLISRVLRAAVDLHKLPNVLISCDCDVLRADGGTRVTSITGAYVALADALRHGLDQGFIKENPIVSPVAAVSVGIVDGKAVLDLDYALDSRAEVDMNVAMNAKGEFIEIQGTGEENTFNRDQLNAMLDLAHKGIGELLELQSTALGAS